MEIISYLDEDYFRIGFTLKESQTWDFPGSSVVKSFHYRISSPILVGELRSHMLHSVAPSKGSLM